MPDLEEVKAAMEVLRPTINADGGDCEIDHIEGGTVFVRMLGACVGCPSVRLTLVHVIEQHFREHVPGVDAVMLAG